MHRRTLLVTLPGTVLGGCLGRTGPRRVRLAWLRLANERDDPYDVGVHIEDGDAHVFDETYRLGTGAVNEETDIEPSLDGLGRYVVHFRADGQTVHVDPTESVDGSGDTVGVRFALHEGGTMGYETVSV